MDVFGTCTQPFLRKILDLAKYSTRQFGEPKDLKRIEMLRVACIVICTRITTCIENINKKHIHIGYRYIL